MGELLKKMMRAKEAVEDIMAEEESSMLTVNLYTYDDFNRFCKKNKKENPNVEKCTVAIEQAKEFDQMVFAENKYIIRILFLDSMDIPIQLECNQEAYLGLIVIASGIDRELRDFMGNEKKKTLIIQRR